MPRVHPGRANGARWQFFISHKQAEAKAEALELSGDLGRGECWLDVHQRDASEEAMEEGVRNSAHFLCILSKGYLGSEFCMKELAWAFSYDKPIILCYLHTVNVGELLGLLPKRFSRLKDIMAIKLDRTHPDFWQVSVKLVRERVNKLAGLATAAPLQQPQPTRAPVEQSAGTTLTAARKTAIARIVGRYSGHGDGFVINESQEYNDIITLTAPPPPYRLGRHEPELPSAFFLEYGMAFLYDPSSSTPRFFQVRAPTRREPEARAMLFLELEGDVLTVRHTCFGFAEASLMLLLPVLLPVYGTLFAWQCLFERQDCEHNECTGLKFNRVFE